MRNLILITTLLGLYTHGVTAQVIDYVDDKYYKLEDGEVKPYKTIKDPYSSDLASLMVTSAPEFEGDIQTSADGKQGKKDADGKIVIPFIYDALYMATEGLYNARIKRKWGLVNSAGKVLAPIEYDKPFSFDYELSMAKKNGQWGWIDMSGKTVIPIVYQEAEGFVKKLARVKIGRAHV